MLFVTVSLFLMGFSLSAALKTAAVLGTIGMVSLTISYFIRAEGSTREGYESYMLSSLFGYATPFYAANAAVVFFNSENINVVCVCTLIYCLILTIVRSIMKEIQC